MDPSSSKIIAIHFIDNERGIKKRSPFPNGAFLVNDLK
jgi:hypothetical protein